MIFLGIDNCNRALATFSGCRARLLFFDTSLMRLVLRLYGAGTQTEMFVVVSGARYLSGPLAWEDVSIQVREEAEVTLVEDRRNGFLLRCHGVLVAEKPYAFPVTSIESLAEDEPVFAELLSEPGTKD